jgi:hypothetical protein
MAAQNDRLLSTPTMITDTEIKMIGVKALTEALGEVNAEKFISLILREPFDYTNRLPSSFLPARHPNYKFL